MNIKHNNSTHISVSALLNTCFNHYIFLDVIHLLLLITVNFIFSNINFFITFIFRVLTCHSFKCLFKFFNSVSNVTTFSHMLHIRFSVFFIVKWSHVHSVHLSFFSSFVNSFECSCTKWSRKEDWGQVVTNFEQRLHFAKKNV